MNFEFARAKAYLAELKTKARELDLRISNNIQNSRDLIYPYDDPEVFDTERIKLTVSDLVKNIEDLKEINVKIKKIERDLK